MEDVIKQVSDALGRIFRYILPGACILIAARLSHPSWFASVDYSQSWQLLLLTVIALCAGNVWYVFHRYTLHQLLDPPRLYDREEEMGRVFKMAD
jgi:hypothetical protein